MVINKFVLFFLISISSMTACQHAEEYDRDGRNRIMGKIFKKTKEHFYEEYNLDLVGPTMSASQGPIEHVTIILEKDADPSIDEAKSMLVDVTSYFYNLVGSNEELTQYLAHPPFHLRDLDVLIVFKHYNLSGYPLPFIASISLQEGQVNLCLFNAVSDLQPVEELWFSYDLLEREFGEQVNAK